MVQGSGIHWLNGQTSPLRPGDLWIVSDVDAHAVYAEKGSTVRIVNVAFPRHAWNSVYAQYFLDEPDAFQAGSNRNFHLDSDGLAQYLCLARMLDNPERDQCALDMLLISIGLLVRRSDAKMEACLVPEWLLGAKSQICEPDCLQRGVEEFVRLAGRSADHVAKMCSKHFGKTPTELINEARLETSARLLAQTSAPIEHVATDCGFPNLSYFYRLFRSRFGFPPGEFRRKTRRITGQGA